MSSACALTRRPATAAEKRQESVAPTNASEEIRQRIPSVHRVAALRRIPSRVRKPSGGAVASLKRRELAAALRGPKSNVRREPERDFVGLARAPNVPEKSTGVLSKGNRGVSHLSNSRDRAPGIGNVQVRPGVHL